MTFAVGIAFQFPLVLILLIRIGILSVKKLRESRRLVLVILMVSAALITPGGDPVSLCILTIPLYILYEFAILFGSFIERSKALREWNEWDESIQGTRPEKPKTEKLSLLLLSIVILAVGGAGFLAWKYQDVIKNSLDWFDTEEIELTIDSNQSANSVIRDTKILLDDNRTLIIELLPMEDANSSLPQRGLYRAKIINSEE
jgi:hypothetical protein